MIKNVSDGLPKGKEVTLLFLTLFDGIPNSEDSQYETEPLMIAALYCHAANPTPFISEVCLTTLLSSV